MNKFIVIDGTLSSVGRLNKEWTSKDSKLVNSIQVDSSCLSNVCVGGDILMPLIGGEGTRVRLVLTQNWCNSGSKQGDVNYRLLGIQREHGAYVSHGQIATIATPVMLPYFMLGFLGSGIVSTINPDIYWLSGMAPMVSAFFVGLYAIKQAERKVKSRVIRLFKFRVSKDGKRGGYEL